MDRQNSSALAAMVDLARSMGEVEQGLDCVYLTDMAGNFKPDPPVFGPFLGTTGSYVQLLSSW